MGGVRRILMVLLLICGLAATMPAQGASLTREKAVEYLQRCESVWYSQAYLYRFRGARFESIENIQNTSLFSHGFKLVVLLRDKNLEESLRDVRLLGNEQWQRQREIASFDGEDLYRWSDYDNRGTISPEGRALTLDTPWDIYGFYGFINGSLSSMVRDAHEFRWDSEPLEVEGETCVRAHCVFRNADGTVERYELYLAVKGALFPKQIQRHVDRGDGRGELLTDAWNAREIEKDTETNIWHLRSGRYINTGARTIFEIEVQARRAVPEEQRGRESFQLRMPPDAKVFDRRKSETLGAANHVENRLHPDVSFLPRFLGVGVEAMVSKLDEAYKEGYRPEWGYDVQMPANASPQ